MSIGFPSERANPQPSETLALLRRGAPLLAARGAMRPRREQRVAAPAACAGSARPAEWAERRPQRREVAAGAAQRDGRLVRFENPTEFFQGRMSRVGLGEPVA